jgi:hypothetical protein
MESFVSHWNAAYKKVNKIGEDKKRERKEEVSYVTTVTLARIM